MTGGIVVIQNGQIAQQGAPRELFESPASEFIADFIGEANVIDCEVVSVGTDTVQIRVGGLLQNLSAPNARTGPAKLAVRANAITVTAATGADLPGQIVSSAYLGDHVEYEIDGHWADCFPSTPRRKRRLLPERPWRSGFATVDWHCSHEYAPKP
jgi:iron(III) transport system ATP-binding protein